MIGLWLLVVYWRTRSVTPEKVPTLGRFALMAGAGALIGPLFYFWFNSTVFGSVFGGYLQSAGGNGFFPADLPEKFISLWLDGFTLYGEHNAALTGHYPWLFISCAGLVWVFLRGDGLLRMMAVAVCLLFALYMPYADLLPSGLWRYLNIHYFKWTFPFLALFGWLLVEAVFTAWRNGKGVILPGAILVAIPILLLSVNIVVDTVPVSISEKADSIHIALDIPNKQVDLIDIKGLSGEFKNHIYFGSHRLILEDRELKPVRDYRVFLRNEGIRILFIRPVSGKTIRFFPDLRLTRSDVPLTADAGAYHFAVGGGRYPW